MKQNERQTFVVKVAQQPNTDSLRYNQKNIYMEHKMKEACTICFCESTKVVYERFGKDCKVPMCEGCHNKFKTIWANRKTDKTSREQVLIHLALKHRGIENILEYFDGYKAVDIAIQESKLYVEVNGLQHAQDARQLVTDMWRDHYSFNKGFLTLHVYNVAMGGNFNNIVNAIREISDERKKIQL